MPDPTLVPEPVAAATYFVDVLDHRVPVGRSVIVYDLGGGTFDACVVRRTAGGFEPLSYQGLDDVGGVDLDELVVGLVGQVAGGQAPDEWQRLLHPTNPADLRHSRVLWEDARLAKEALSRQSSAGVFVPLVDRDVHVTREQFESGARAALTRTAEATMSAIRQARITPADVAGLFLVGGSTRVPMVATLLHQRVGLAPIALEQPEIVVAEGALHHQAVPGAAGPAPANRPGPYPPARPAAAAPGGPESGAPIPDGLVQTSGGSGPVPGGHGDHSQARRVSDGTAPVSALPGAATPVSALPGAATPLSGPGEAPPATPRYQAAPPAAGSGAQAGPARSPRRRRRLALILGLCAAVLVLALVAAGVAYKQLTTPRALPTDLHQHACKYIDMTPLYRKFGVAKPSAAPVSNGKYKVFTECLLDTSNRRKGIDITKVQFDVQTDASDAAAGKDYDFWVAGMRSNDRYPVKKLSIGDEAAIGPLPDLIAASATGSSPSPTASPGTDSDPGPGLQIVVRKADYVLLIEVDLETNGNIQYENGPRPVIPRARLDKEADALAQTAKASLAKVSAVMK
jgi:hypothetical protein